MYVNVSHIAYSRCSPLFPAGSLAAGMMCAGELAGGKDRWAPSWELAAGSWELAGVRVGW